jgi:hypothetical protein
VSTSIATITLRVPGARQDAVAPPGALVAGPDENMFYFRRPEAGERARAETMQFNLADLFEIVVDTVPHRLALVAGPTWLMPVKLQKRSFVQLGCRSGLWVSP